MERLQRAFFRFYWQRTRDGSGGITQYTRDYYLINFD